MSVPLVVINVNWVIMFVRSGSEENLLAVHGAGLRSYGFEPFVPTKETRFKNKQAEKIIRTPLFPGYIFLNTSAGADYIVEKLGALIQGARSMYSLLYYGENKMDIIVRDEERYGWERLFNKEYCVTGSRGFIEGEHIKISSGPLTGMESRIKKINRHQRKAVVEVEMMGASREITLMLEIVEKIV